MEYVDYREVMEKDMERQALIDAGVRPIRIGRNYRKPAKKAAQALNKGLEIAGKAMLIIGVFV